MAQFKIKFVVEGTMIVEAITDFAARQEVYSCLEKRVETTTEDFTINVDPSLEHKS